MISPSEIKKLAAIAGASAALALSSCTLPPEQAWHKIRTDGLISYWAYELHSPYSEWSPQQSTPSTTPSTAPSHVAKVTKPSPSPAVQPNMMDTGATLTAQSIPALPGYVRSPYTNPPRLVDVKGAAPGSTMICPYTQRPFIIPPDYVNPTGSSALADADPSIPLPEASPTPTPTPKQLDQPLPKVVIGGRSAPSAPGTSKQSDKPAPNKAASTPSTEPTMPLSSVAPLPPAAPKVVQDIPFGNPIPGRPGFVNSPFAAKHQLVDVTGLPAGMEVKCPYTGKLFRVPPQDMASTNPANTAPLASPEEPKKK